MTAVKLVHEGVAYSRTKRNDGFEDTMREKAFSEAWKKQNPPVGSHGIQPILNALLPDATERDAVVAATTIQWLGSQVGFHFLGEVLAKAGYEISVKKK